MSIITEVSLEHQMRMNPSLDKKVIAELKEWNQKQTHLPELRDADLALFYLKNSNNLEATKENINNYFVMRHHMPELFVDRKDLQSAELKQVFDTVFIVTLPQRTKDNHKVLLARLLDTEPSKYNFENAVKVMNMVLDAGIYEDGPDNKYVMVFDLNGATMEHSKSLSFMGLKKFFEYMRKASPIRWIGTHYVNTGASDNNDLQNFIKTQVANGTFADSSMVQVHANMDALLKATGIEKSMLPKEMGGAIGTAMELQKKQVKKLESLFTFFAGQDKCKLTNTDKIPSAFEMFGPEKAF